MVNHPNPPVPTVELSNTGAESAPFIYFDGVVTGGIHHGTIRLELAAGTIVPTPDGKTKTVHVITGHLRCSPSAAAELRKAIDGALLLLTPAKGQPS